MSKKKKDKAINKRQNALGYAFLTPWLIGFFVFTAFPFIYTIYLSFHQVSQTIKGVETTFSGLENYNVALLRNPDFTKNLVSFLTMELTYAPTIIVIAFILALLLNRDIKFRSVFRALFFLPVIVMSGSVMSQLMDAGGTANTSIESMALYRMIFNFSRPAADALGVLFENYSMVLWFTGIPIVLFINGLQKINPSVIEAATIDSATPWQILWKITVPIVRPIVMLATIFTIIQLGLYSVNPIFVQIQDAMNNSAGGLGLASVFAWIYSIVVLALIGVAFLLLKPPKEVIAKAQKRREKRWNEV